MILSLATLVCNDVSIVARESDGYINLNKLAEANKKRLDNWLRTKDTKEFLQELSEKGIAPIKSSSVKNHPDFGSWGDPKVAERFLVWNKRGKPSSPEALVRDSLAETLKDFIAVEIPCKTGVVDIVSGSEIIEVKAAKSWKSAVGQALIYSLEFEGKKPRVHLFGVCSTEFKLMVRSFCERVNVAVSFDDQP